MSRLRVAPIVEGHGEVTAVPLLLRRIWRDLLAGEYVDVLQPVRVPRSKVIRRPGTGGSESVVDGTELSRAIELATYKIENRGDPDTPALILVLFDANSDCPATLAPRLCASAPQANVVCVLAKVEYETWFVAAANSLSEFLDLKGQPPPSDPEAVGTRKKWIEDRFRGSHYSETVDQPALTARMDLRECRAKSPSFDKLCRELERFRTSS